MKRTKTMNSKLYLAPELPGSILERIFRRLNFTDKCSARSVCWSWNHILHTGSQFQQLVLDETDIPKEMMVPHEPNALPPTFISCLKYVAPFVRTVTFHSRDLEPAHRSSAKQIQLHILSTGEFKNSEEIHFKGGPVSFYHLIAHLPRSVKSLIFQHVYFVDTIFEPQWNGQPDGGILCHGMPSAELRIDIPLEEERYYSSFRTDFLKRRFLARAHFYNRMTMDPGAMVGIPP